MKRERLVIHARGLAEQTKNSDPVAAVVMRVWADKLEGSKIVAVKDLLGEFAPVRPRELPPA